MGGIHD